MKTDHSIRRSTMSFRRWYRPYSTNKFLILSLNFLVKYSNDTVVRRKLPCLSFSLFLSGINIFWGPNFPGPNILGPNFPDFLCNMSDKIKYHNYIFLLFYTLVYSFLSIELLFYLVAYLFICLINLFMGCLVIISGTKFSGSEFSGT